MAKNLYHVLEASETASQATLKILFEQRREDLQDDVDAGKPSAKTELWALNEAYATLSNSDKREAYDKTLRGLPRDVAQRRSVAQRPEGLSWKLNALLIALLVSGLVGFGLQMGRANKKDEVAVKVLEVTRTTDNDAARAATERIQVEGSVQNTSKSIETQGQIANRIVGIQESAESRTARELEYRANAGAEILRQQQERLKMQNEQLQWERRQAEQALATRQGQDRAASDRMRAIQMAISNGRLTEARSYVETPQESAMVSAAVRADCRAHATTASQRNRC